CELVIEHAPRALHAARAMDDADLEHMSLRLLANAHALIGQLDVSARILTEVTKSADLGAEPIGIIRSFQGLVQTYIESMRTDEARRAADELHRFVRVRGLDNELPTALAARARAEQSAG